MNALVKDRFQPDRSQGCVDFRRGTSIDTREKGNHLTSRLFLRLPHSAIALQVPVPSLMSIRTPMGLGLPSFHVQKRFGNMYKSTSRSRRVCACFVTMRKFSILVNRSRPPFLANIRSHNCNAGDATEFADCCVDPQLRKARKPMSANPRNVMCQKMLRKIFIISPGITSIPLCSTVPIGKS